ncbi:hypothetical protein BLA34_12735 [Ralstonia solanacearum]|nr:hypothetical protein BLA34_12735 [Ralstonia solanacearum]
MAVLQNFGNQAIESQALSQTSAPLVVRGAFDHATVAVGQTEFAIDGGLAILVVQEHFLIKIAMRQANGIGRHTVGTDHTEIARMNDAGALHPIDNLFRRDALIGVADFEHDALFGLDDDVAKGPEMDGTLGRGAQVTVLCLQFKMT